MPRHNHALLRASASLLLYLGACTQITNYNYQAAPDGGGGDAGRGGDAGGGGRQGSGGDAAGSDAGRGGDAGGGGWQGSGGDAGGGDAGRGGDAGGGGRHSAPSIVQLLAQVHLTCALDSRGEVWCWGHNATTGVPAPGDGATACGRPSKVTVLEGAGREPAKVTALSLGYRHACAIVESGNIVCWGDDDRMELESGTFRTIRLENDGKAQALGCGDGYCCALSEAGQVSCWGSNDCGQLGRNMDTGTDAGVTNARVCPGAEPGAPEVVTLPTSFVPNALTVGDYHACAVDAAGQVVCWGWRRFNSFGDGKDDAFALPVEVTWGPQQPKAHRLFAGNRATCDVSKVGKLRCWGAEDSGRTGIGASSIAPEVGLTDVEPVGFINAHTCFVGKKGSAEGLFCWGRNSSGKETKEVTGQVGQGCDLDAGSSVEPVLYFDEVVAPLDVGDARVIQAAGGAYHTCALLDDGTVTCWGRSKERQLGYPTNIPLPQCYPAQGTVVFPDSELANCE